MESFLRMRHKRLSSTTPTEEDVTTPERTTTHTLLIDQVRDDHGKLLAHCACGRWAMTRLVGAQDTDDSLREQAQESWAVHLTLARDEAMQAFDRLAQIALQGAAARATVRRGPPEGADA